MMDESVCAVCQSDNKSCREEPSENCETWQRLAEMYVTTLERQED